MNRETSLYLDAWRFLAATIVFQGHVSGVRFTGGLLWQLDPYMSEAVTVFFVLSGFVIGYASDQGAISAASYAVARAARIYSVAFPALILTFGLDAIGRSLQPDLYAPSWGYVADGRVWQFVSGLFFVNQFWFTNVTQGSDLPYWSLGYEVWYYVIFGVAKFARRRWRIAGIGLLLLFVGPPIAAMFPLWLLGLLGYRFCTSLTPGRTVGAMLYLGSLAAWIAYEHWAQGHGRLTSTLGDALKRPELAQDYLVGTLFSLQLIGFCSISSVFRPVLDRLARSIRWISGATFTLYLLHLPVAQFLTAVVPWSPSSLATRIVMIGGTLAIMFAVAEVTERRKDAWRRGFALLRKPVSLESVGS